MIDCKTEPKGGYRHELRIDTHTLFADLGKAAGGEDTAPGPHEYFDAALAACKAITVMMYAKSHHFALDAVRVHIERDATHEREGTYVLTVGIGFEGALSEAEKQRLFEISTRCPIHKLMTTSKVEINSALMA